MLEQLDMVQKIAGRSWVQTSAWSNNVRATGYGAKDCWKVMGSNPCLAIEQMENSLSVKPAVNGNLFCSRKGYL